MRKSATDVSQRRDHGHPSGRRTIRHGENTAAGLVCRSRLAGGGGGRTEDSERRKSIGDGTARTVSLVGSEKAMKKMFAIVGVALLLGSIASFTNRTQMLTASQCSEVTGMLWFHCQHAATCDASLGNQLCPNSVGPCQHCDGSGEVLTCQQVIFANNCLDTGHADVCGNLLRGYCNNNVCANMVWFGEHCGEVRSCINY